MPDPDAVADPTEDVDLFREVVGQPQAVATLRAAARRPVHAYLLVGPPGSGKRLAAIRFAASLLCPSGGDGTCDTCRRVLAEVHPDLVVVEREGASIGIDTAREVSRLSARSPLEGDRKVLLLTDFHLVREAGPALLKTIEEPPPSTVFVILAEFVPPELVTIASRCVVVDFRPLSDRDIVADLRARGLDEHQAAELAAASEGRLDRARLLMSDPEFAARRRTWLSVPGRLDGTGATAAAIADELIGLLDRSTEPLRARQQDEQDHLEARIAWMNEVNGRQPRGARGARTGAKELEDRHKRELRRYRTDELRAGLAGLAGVYRDRLVGGGPGAGGALAALGAIQQLNADLIYNPGELLALQALMVNLSRPI
jgi:DNA polymerase-3 subunit delta'